jgi:hypothetical protein
MQMEDCRIAIQVAELNQQGKRGRCRSVSTWMDGMQRRDLTGNERFYRELWRKSAYSQINSFSSDKILITKVITIFTEIVHQGLSLKDTGIQI